MFKDGDEMKPTWDEDDDDCKFDENEKDVYEDDLDPDSMADGERGIAEHQPVNMVSRSRRR